MVQLSLFLCDDGAAPLPGFTPHPRPPQRSLDRRSPAALLPTRTHRAARLLQPITGPGAPDARAQSAPAQRSGVGSLGSRAVLFLTLEEGGGERRHRRGCKLRLPCGWSRAEALGKGPSRSGARVKRAAVRRGLTLGASQQPLSARAHVGGGNHRWPGGSGARPQKPAGEARGKQRTSGGTYLRRRQQRLSSPPNFP